jgi:proteasome lid subunit RPN8/RPN11
MSGSASPVPERARDDGSDPGRPAATPVGVPVVILPAAIRDAIVASARAALPDEMCGLVTGSAPAAAGGRALGWEPARNAAASPFRFDVAPEDLIRITLAIDDRDEVLWGIAHSHVRSPARPSPTDVADATLASHADVVHLIVSLDPSEAEPGSGAPAVRAWWIAGGQAREARMEIR